MVPKGKDPSPVGSEAIRDCTTHRAVNPNHTGTAEPELRGSQENLSLSKALGSGSCHPWNTPGPPEPPQGAPPCPLPAQENHTTCSLLTIKPSLFLAAPQKGSAGMQEGVLGS